MPFTVCAVFPSVKPPVLETTIILLQQLHGTAFLPWLIRNKSFKLCPTVTEPVNFIPGNQNPPQHFVFKHMDLPSSFRARHKSFRPTHNMEIHQETSTALPVPH
jgi:hypothetical protein